MVGDAASVLICGTNCTLGRLPSPAAGWRVGRRHEGVKEILDDSLLLSGRMDGATGLLRGEGGPGEERGDIGMVACGVLGVREGSEVCLWAMEVGKSSASRLTKRLVGQGHWNLAASHADDVLHEVRPADDQYKW